GRRSPCGEAAVGRDVLSDRAPRPGRPAQATISRRKIVAPPLPPCLPGRGRCLEPGLDPELDLSADAQARFRLRRWRLGLSVGTTGGKCKEREGKHDTAHFRRSFQRETCSRTRAGAVPPSEVRLATEFSTPRTE